MSEVLFHVIYLFISYFSMPIYRNPVAVVAGMFMFPLSSLKYY